MKKYDLVLLTEQRYDKPKQVDWYVENILTEDGLVKKALEKNGLNVLRLDWANTNFDWTSTRYVLFRTTWDYFDRFKEFTHWLDSTSKLTQMINSFELIKWNMDKAYLADLQNKDVRIAPTIFIKKGNPKKLIEVLEGNKWHEAVLKPAIAGAARHTYRINKSNIKNVQAIFDELVMEEDFLLQEFQTKIVSEGEVSLIIMGGKFTHAVLKIAKPGDFRVQDDFGGTVHTYTPSQEEIAFAENSIKACPELPFYARVDIFRDNGGQLALGELELIEPELWFRENPQAAELLAEVIVRKCF